jgi:hypothetical protein
MAEITYTIKTKIFNERTIGDLQKSMNDWLNNNKVEILHSSTSAYPMFDFYKSKDLLECDRWMQYSAMIIYHEDDSESRRKRNVKERFDMIKKGEKPAFCGVWITKEENTNCVNHKNYDKNNNSVDNLEWCTHSDNIKHAHKKVNRKRHGRKTI